MLILVPSVSFGNSGKEFTTSVIYGALAGTIVGAASLAFTSSPGENLGNVARGASYGLYAGILLGLYVTWGLDDRPGDSRQEQPAPGTNDNGVQPSDPNQQGAPNGDNPGPQGAYDAKPLELKPHSPLYALSVYPIVNFQNGHDLGVGATFLNLNF